MTKKMLIDAAHPEETRVVVVDGKRVEEFDFEAQAKRQLRGNIYLARVTRVEPSLQAAFVEYGGNRHGFLAFNEIHPDYYQIPFEDRQALLEEERALQRSAASRENGEDASEDEADTEADASAETDAAEPSDVEGASETDGDDDDSAAEASRRRARILRKYKIQEVIKRRQILLVQVVKEERGNKGAALTTYLSLAGRYCVLMPNTARGGGISRKITSATDRKRLRKIVDEFAVPDGMGLIVRTAGAKRTKAEVKRDYEYLLRVWETIRSDTLKSVAPCLVHEEDNLVKRAIRDLYDKDVEEVLVEGDTAYREAKDFIRMLMPSHAKKVQPYREESPLFLRERVEEQLEQIYNPTVALKSGGYLVINQTEALVAIDVNSGRSTRERNIEATALKTNLEAAEEACRQFRLRDLAGLIVIDFIDMEEAKNTRSVEKRMRDGLKRDRARVQTSKISGFGLMELSRQRRRASILEGSHTECQVCKGRGIVRSVESSALHTLRSIEEEGVRGQAGVVRVTAATDVALYLLNEKRAHLNATQDRYGMMVLVNADSTLIPPECTIERLESRKREDVPAALPPPVEEPVEVEADAEPAAEDGEEPAKKRRRRRRRRRGGADGEGETEVAADVVSTESPEDDEADDEERDVSTADDDDGDKPKRRRRRGRRGGRGRRNGEAGTEAEPEGMRVVDPEAEAGAPALAETTVVALEAAPQAPEATMTEPTTVGEDEPVAETQPSEPPLEPAPEPPPEALIEEAAQVEDTATVAEEVEAPAPTPKPRARRKPKPKPAPEPAAEAEDTSEAADVTAVKDGVAPVESAPEPEPEPLPEPEPEPEPALAAPSAEPDPEAEERRQRWQDRLKTWLNG